jgi:arylsulfatase
MVARSHEPQRGSLPIPDRPHTGIVTYDARDPHTAFPAIEPMRPPAGAPNVLLILLDDVGFAASSAFGGAIDTPTAERLAASGLRYTRFHTTALCAPTRAALLTGRNHHSVGMGCVPDLATSAPGYSSIRPNTAAPLPEILRLNGYSTAMFGKCHEVPFWETSPMGPFDRWPTGSGFEHFYGFLGGETNQYAPALYEGTTPIEPERTAEEGYHLTEDLADRTIAWVRQQQALMPGKPFFAYVAPGATHAPHHAPKAWSDKYKGRFDAGWDALREEIVERQRAMGIIPPDAQLTDRPEEIPAWDAMPDALKPVLARQMEVYAGFLEHVDHHVGRIVDAIEELGILENTLVLYLVGDNGASAEGTVHGSFNEMLMFNGAAHIETAEMMAARIDDFGGPGAYNHYAVGWAHAMDTPYQWTKQVASHWGGTRNGTIVHWPARIAARGELRTQFHHVIDVAPTILEVAGIPAPAFVNGVQQQPLHGVSMTPTFADAAAPEAHTLQYFEVFVNRGIYHEGWTAVTRHSTPWVVGPLPAFDDDVWELYAPDDWTQSDDLAAAMPDKLKELQRLFLIEAVRYGVLPLDDRRVERFDAATAGRPQLIHGTTQMLYGGMGRLTESSVINIKNRSHAVTARFTVPDGPPATGVIVAQGGAFGGWTLYLLEGRPVYCYNLFGLQRFKVAGDAPVGAGTHELRMAFTYDGGGPAKGGEVTLLLDGAIVADGRLPATEPLVFSGDETTDVGSDTATPVSDDYTPATSRFPGRIDWVRIDVGEDALVPGDHPTAEDRFRLAMGRQ